ncbi:MAG: transposase [Pseudonocardiaceae bacterium]
MPPCSRPPGPRTGRRGPTSRASGSTPLTAWCANIGDSLAVMLRPGNAGSFTASDHLAVLDAAFTQSPATWRTDVLVSIDGAGASHEIIDYLSGLNTATVHGKRARRVEYTIGWPVDERTLGGISELRQREALDADGVCDSEAQVADLTGILRAGHGGDRLATWPTDLRVIARRVPRPAGKPAKLGEDPDWEYGAFATNTATGQTQWLDARHRTQAHVAGRVKQLKAGGARNLPSIDYHRNTAWLQLAALATSLTAWLRHLALAGDLAKAGTTTLRFSAPVHPSPPPHPPQTQDLESPTRLGLGPRPRHRLGPAPSPTPRLTHPPPSRPTSTTRPNRGNRRPPEHHRDHRHTQDRHLRRSPPQIQTIMKLWISVNDLGPRLSLPYLIGLHVGRRRADLPASPRRPPAPGRCSCRRPDSHPRWRPARPRSRSSRPSGAP